MSNQRASSGHPFVKRIGNVRWEFANDWATEEQAQADVVDLRKMGLMAFAYNDPLYGWATYRRERPGAKR